MAIRWEAEACDLGFDEQTGAWVTRLTSSVMSNINIYYEQPHTNADDTRFVYLRAPSSDPRLPPGQELCVADLRTLKIMVVDRDVQTNWVATSPWSGKVAYLRSNGELILFDMDTLEKQILLTHWPLPANANIWSLSPDMKYLAAASCDSDYNFHLHRVDLTTRTFETVYTHRWLHNHIQINHVHGNQVLLQRNAGARMNDLRQIMREKVDGPASAHVIVDFHTGKETPLNIGEHWCARSTGHASWVGGTGKMATPLNTMGNFFSTRDRPNPPRTHDERHPQGNMAIVGPGDDRPRVLHAPDMCFNHSSMSRCGKYFVADEFSGGTGGAIRIVVGNIETGKMRILLHNCGAHGGGAASTHPHPYFTANMKFVIFNADPHHVCHIHSAQLPDDFLASLD